MASGLGRLLALIALAALYGALHDQVSYGLGPDYFTCLKFPQFGLLDTALAPHWRAARVGLQAGAVAGLPLGALGCALLGLGLGWLALNLGSVLRVPDCVQDRGGFLLAAWMHDGSYLGALLGLLVFAWRNRRRR